MKNTLLTTLALLIAMVTLVLASCDDGNGENHTPSSKKTLTGTPTISETAEVGKTLTANTDGLNGTDGKYAYQWTRSPDGATVVEITGAASLTDYSAATDSKPAKHGVTIAEPPVKIFLDQTMFADNGTDYKADIIDTRTQAGSKTLEQLGIIGKFQAAASYVYDNATGLSGNALKNRMRNVFGENNTKGKVKMIVENGVTYASYEVDDSANVRWNFDYLSTVSDADLQAAIASAVQAMNPANPNLPFEIARAKDPLQGRVFVVGGMSPVKQTAARDGWVRYTKAMQRRDNHIVNRRASNSIG